MEEEIWKDVIGYEGLYKVSNLGRVYSLNPIRGRKDKNDRILSCTPIKAGYTIHGLHKNGKSKNWLTHRLIAIHFIENPHNYPFINHKNSVRNDNRLENLEWCTQSMNIKHGYDQGYIKSRKGKKSPTSGPPRKAVLQYDSYMNFIREFKSTWEASRILNINQTSISRCCRGIIKKSHGFIFKFKE